LHSSCKVLCNLCMVFLLGSTCTKLQTIAGSTGCGQDKKGPDGSNVNALFSVLPKLHS